MKYKSWTRTFWIALNPDAGKSTLRFDTFDDGKTILEMIGTVHGRGVLLRWLSAEHGVVTIRANRYGCSEERLDGEQTPMSTQDDPYAFAAHVRQRLLAIAQHALPLL